MALRLAVFDLAGTVLDRGSRASINALKESFVLHGIHLPSSQFLLSHGTHKLATIKYILEHNNLHNNESLVSSIYETFNIILPKHILERSILFPEFLEIVPVLRDKYKLKIAHNTGYVSNITNIIVDSMKKQNY